MDRRPPVRRRSTRANSARSRKMIAKAIRYLTAGDRVSVPGIDNKDATPSDGAKKAEADFASLCLPSLGPGATGDGPWLTRFLSSVPKALYGPLTMRAADFAGLFPESY